MKSLKYIFSALAVLAAVSCSNDEYTPGEPDLADSYDVFFDAGQSDNIEFNVKDKRREVKITATRNNTADAITVPVVIKGDNSVIFTTPLEFKAGQSSSSFKLTFSGLVAQQKYDFLIAIEDPKYALTYGLESTTVNLSVIDVDYEKRYDGTYNCALLRSPFKVNVEYSKILNKYRITDTWTGNGDPIVFDWDGKSEAVTMEKGTALNTALDYDGNGNYIRAVYQAAQYFPEEKGFIFIFEYSIPGIGSFGPQQDSMIIK